MCNSGGLGQCLSFNQFVFPFLGFTSHPILHSNSPSQHVICVCVWCGVVLVVGGGVAGKSLLPAILIAATEHNLGET